MHAEQVLHIVVVIAIWSTKTISVACIEAISIKDFLSLSLYVTND